MEIKSNGCVYGCCEGWMPQPLGNVLDTPLVDIWQGPKAKEVRASIMDGSFRFCTACPYLPGPGGPVVEASPAGQPTTTRIRTLKMDYDQSCNLTCPSCRVEHSNQFVDLKLVKQIHEKVMSSGIVELTDQLYITGAGDPFASPVFWPLLQDFPMTSHKPKIFLHTNGQLFDARHWELMASSRELIADVGISVDAACEKTYTENRRASWTRLWNNVDFVNFLQADRQITLGMFFTVQANNYRELIPFLRLAFNHNVEWISITALRNWGVYTDYDYAIRAVHVPGHPMHEDFKAVLADPMLKDKRIIVDTFNPRHTSQATLVQLGDARRKV
jgi:MoaA/NifB/PqqE/SkfB family radical SAM enzyme